MGQQRARYWFGCPWAPQGGPGARSQQHPGTGRNAGVTPQSLPTDRASGTGRAAAAQAARAGDAHASEGTAVPV